MKRKARAAAPGRSPGVGWPLVWSAAGHAAVLAACLVLGAGGDGERASRRVPVVEVLVVGGAPRAGGTGLRGTAGTDAPRLSPDRPAALPGRGTPAPPEVAANAIPDSARREERAARAGVSEFRPAAVSAAAGAEAVPGVPALRSDPAGPAVVSGSGGGPPDASAAGGAPRESAAASVGGGAGTGGNPPGSDRAPPGIEAGLLRERIQSRIVYPPEAVRRGLEGEVLLRIRVEAGGVPRDIRIARSSGARLLDDAARRGVVGAAPLPSLPGWVEVPVRFRLQ